MNINNLKVETEDAFTSLLELAANNDLEAFKRLVDQEPASINEVGLWYIRQKGSNQMALQHMTPLMVAATYGSIDVLKHIISLPEADINQTPDAEKITALHCAASGGSHNAVEAVKLLLAAGADPNITTSNGHRSFDVITVSPKLNASKCSLQTMLATDPFFDEERNSSPDMSLNLDIFPESNGVSTPRKEYPVDPSLPDIKNSIYSTDEFRMFSFKVRPCSRAYSHDWTECPFVHPGENARRRDPRKYHYSCVPCPDFRKGACRRGDMCEYAHGVFECWLHPAQYRTRLCKDGTGCNRRVCFFAHTQDELRPLYVSTGSAVPSPRSGGSAIDFAAQMTVLPPGSPSSPFTPPMSPSANGGILNPGWVCPQNVPTLHLPGSNLQSSRLRSSLHARDIPPEDLSLYADIEALNELSLMNNNLLNRSVRPKTLNPSNLEDILSSEVFSPTHKSAILNQFQQQQQSMLSPIKTTFSPRNMDHSLMQQAQASYGVPSPGRMSPRNVDPISPMSARMGMLARQDKQNHHQFRSLSSRDLGSNAAAAIASLEESRSKWGPHNGQPEWGPIKRSSSFELLNTNGEEPDLSWVQSLVKESPQDMKEKSSAAAGPSSSANQIEQQVDQSVLGAWLEQMQLDQLMAQ